MSSGIYANVAQVECELKMIQLNFRLLYYMNSLVILTKRVFCLGRIFSTPILICQWLYLKYFGCYYNTSRIIFYSQIIRLFLFYFLKKSSNIQKYLGHHVVRCQQLILEVYYYNSVRLKCMDFSCLCLTLVVVATRSHLRIEILIHSHNSLLSPDGNGGDSFASKWRWRGHWH